MLKPTQWLRLIKIKMVLIRYILTPNVVGEDSRLLRLLCYLNPWNYQKTALTRGESIRLAFEKLGPIYIKLGQTLSTRRDLIPADIVDELEKLQDQVPPFPGEKAIKIIEKAHHCSIQALFASFDVIPLASASVAQVHTATLVDGADVVIKIIRPGIAKIIKNDISVLFSIARLMEFFWSQGRRLHPVALIAEFERVIYDELDMRREAANASQLRRNFIDSQKLYVPKIYWDYVCNEMLVMERISGVRISDVATLHFAGTNMKKLAEHGVEIFFTQVFRDNFFHADMHPGNLFIDITSPENPKYIGVDFGIMGSLSPFDQRYLAENLIAFFDRDYHRVAMLHYESGWIPAYTRVELFEAAIRTVCEPIFERPLHEISFGKLLLQLFTTAERFNMEIQPQLMLLQKTLLSIEGLGRQLYPQLNLWETAQPFMQRWIKQKYSFYNVLKVASRDWPGISDKLARAPKTLLTLLEHAHHSLQPQNSLYKQNLQIRHGRKQGIIMGIGIALILLPIFAQTLNYPLFPIKATIFLAVLGGVLLSTVVFRKRSRSGAAS